MCLRSVSSGPPLLSAADPHQPSSVTPTRSKRSTTPLPSATSPMTMTLGPRALMSPLPRSSPRLRLLSFAPPSHTHEHCVALRHSMMMYAHNITCNAHAHTRMHIHTHMLFLSRFFSPLNPLSPPLPPPSPVCDFFFVSLSLSPHT